MTTKQWLSRGYKLDCEINALLQEQSKALSKATNTAMTGEGEKVQISPSNTAEKNMLNYAAYSELIDKRIDELYKIKHEILKAILKVDDNACRVLLICRYMNYKSWDEIAEQMKYSKRQVLRMHSEILKNLKDVTKCP